MDAELIFIAAALCLAGFVKGIIGFGLPIVAISILSLFIPIDFALALLVFPLFATNFFLAIKGGHTKEVFVRFWPLIIFLGIGLFISAQILAGMKEQYLFLVLGSVLLSLMTVDLLKGHVQIPPRLERPLSLPIGFISGMIGGISSSYGPPIALFLAALKLPKELFVSVLGTILCSGSIFLALAFGSVNILNSDNIVWSVLAIIPCMVGLWVGGYLRYRIPQQLFYRLILSALVIVALNLIRKGLAL